jgi:hypothetical protein
MNLPRLCWQIGQLVPAPCTARRVGMLGAELDVLVTIHRDAGAGEPAASDPMNSPAPFVDAHLRHARNDRISAAPLVAVAP